MTLGGAIVALTTPFDAGGGVDLDALGRHVEWLVAEGASGLVPAGTTGEGPLLDDEEVLAVIGRTVEAAAGGVPVIAHVGRPGTAATARLGRAAANLGAGLLMAVVPYYYPLSQEQVAAHYVELLEALDGVPLLAYAIPGHAGNDLDAETFGALLGRGLHGLKDSTKSLERFDEFLAAARQARPSAPVLVGSDPLVAGARRRGGQGSMTAMANVAPKVLSALHGAADAGDWDEVEARQAELLRERSALGPGGTARATKRAIAARVPGGYPEAVRAPL